jgi:hypothetical protein
MHTGRALGVVASAALVALACGGGGPQAPTQLEAPGPTSTPRPSGWSEGTVLTVVSGETQDPVFGAKVFVAGVPRLTDADGRVTVAAAAEGATVDVEAEGFLTRKTLVRYGETRLTLWPVTEQRSESYTQTLVYTSASSDGPENVVPLERLPPNVRTLSLEPSDALKADWYAMGAHVKATDYFNAAVQGRLTFSVGGAADMTVPTTIDSADEACTSPGTLVTRLWLSNHEIMRAEIVYCSVKPSRLAKPILHEMGHVYGLQHSASGRDVMFRLYNPNFDYGFTDPEVVTMALMYQRHAGNVWPDDDRTATSGTTRVRVFVD